MSAFDYDTSPRRPHGAEEQPGPIGSLAPPADFIHAPTAQTVRHVLGYASALATPLLIMVFCTRAEMPAFVFEHAIVILIVCISLPFGLGPAVVAAIVSALGHNLLLVDSVGRATITGMRSVLDALLFVLVAVTVGGLVAIARSEKDRTAAAIARGRHARDERDGLVAILMHELAAPLGAICDSIPFTRQGGANVSADMERLWVRLDRTVARAMSLIRTLGDGQALDSGVLKLDVERVDLRSLIAIVVQTMDRVSERHPVALLMPNHPVIIDGDPERLQRVFESLVSNAIKYSPDGGAVEIALILVDGEAVVRVQDHGIGISPEAQTRIFQRGYRAPEAKAIAFGLGLGLHISGEIVRSHGGSLCANPGNPSGSMFMVRLPTASVGSTSARATPTTSTSNGVSESAN